MSKISSYPTLSSSTTQAIYNLFIPNATGLISYSFFHTNPSNSIAKIFFATAFKSYSASNTLTSNIIIDFATGFSFFFAYYSYYFFYFNFSASASASPLSSANGSKSSSYFFSSGFFVGD